MEDSNPVSSSTRNTWDDGANFRQGSYGNHVTLKGKIVYQRKRRRFTEKDIARITKNFAETIPAETTQEEAWTIWEFLLETMQHIINGVKLLAGFDSRGNFGAWLSFFDEILKWLKDNKAWAEEWQPRWEKAIAAFWQAMK